MGSPDVSDPAVTDSPGLVKRHGGGGRSRVRLLLALLLAAGVGAGITAVALPRTPSPTEGGAASRLPPAGLHLYFVDDFRSPALDRTKWDTCWPGTGTSGCTTYGNAELQWFLPEQDRVSGNALHLVASKGSTPGTDQNGAPATYSWRSGMVTTYTDFRFTYGYVEVTARLPQGNGLWPALWLLTPNKQSLPEIDIAEMLYPQTVQVVLHPLGADHEYTFLPSHYSGWHTFAVDWEPTSITWYVDDKEVFRYRGAGIPDGPMYFVASLAVANYPSAAPDASTPDPASLDIGRVAIYQSHRP